MKREGIAAIPNCSDYTTFIEGKMVDAEGFFSKFYDWSAFLEQDQPEEPGLTPEMFWCSPCWPA
jgi:hypothetical protein